MQPTNEKYQMVPNARTFSDTKKKKKNEEERNEQNNFKTYFCISNLEVKQLNSMMFMMNRHK